MLPMKCPQCGSRAYRAVITNNLIDSQTIRKRRCQSCGHIWFTVELTVPDYAMGWSHKHEGKPVLRMAIPLIPEHIEVQDTSDNLRRYRQKFMESKQM